MKIFYVLVFLVLIVFCKQELYVPELATPDDFEVSVVVDSIPGGARHIAVNEMGDIYVKLMLPGKGGNVALRDTNGDGRADVIQSFGSYKDVGRYGTAMRIYNGYVYFSTELLIMRMKLSSGAFIPEGNIDTIVIDDHAHGTHEHNGKPIAFDESGHIYVPFGAPSNACQEYNRVPFSKGLYPCPQLEDHGGIWRFDANKKNQTQKDGYKYASGLRSIVGIEWNKTDHELYVVMHGRDDLYRMWPDKFTDWQSALLPSEEFLKVEEGSHSGWPYCYYDQLQNKKVLAPEYGGDGKVIGGCDTFNAPVVGFPGHWAPNDLFFYTGNQFPDHYKNGAFVSMHGSTNRNPYSQSGYCIAFVPWENGAFKKEYEIFADGFAQKETMVSVSEAIYRPMGIAMGPDGSIYLAETENGKIWRIKYKGDKSKFGDKQLAAMKIRMLESKTLHNPTEHADIVQKNNTKSKAEQEYTLYCGGCHQKNGLGTKGRFPTLVSDWVIGDKDKLIDAVLNGLNGEIKINNESFTGAMPKNDYLSDEQIAGILTYIRSNFGNTASQISPADVSTVRSKNKEN